MNEVERLVDATYLGNTLWQLTVAAGIATGAFFILLLIRRAIRARYQKLAATPQTEFLELPFRVASSTTVLTIAIAALFIGTQWLNLPGTVSKVMLTIFTIAIFWQVGVWATVAVVAVIERRKRATLASDAAAASSLGIIGFLARATIWSLVLLLTLDNLGIEIKPLLAGLGIGGIAVAFALQQILGDVFCSVAIVLDRPFEVGDFIISGDHLGTV